MAAEDARGEKAHKRKRIPRHPALKFLLPYLGACKEPKTRTERLMEFIDTELTVEGFHGFEHGVFAIRELFEQYEVDANSKEGQKILRIYVSHVLEGQYGDFSRYHCCDNCGKEFKPEYSVEYANRVSAEAAFCAECDKGEQP